MKWFPDVAWPLLIIVTVFTVSGRSSIATPDVGITLDKLGHFLVFGMLATSMLRLPRLREAGWKGALIAAVITMIYGALDEWRQSFTPGRQVEFGDWIADVLGALTAVTVYTVWPWYRRILEWTFPSTVPDTGTSGPRGTDPPAP